MNIIVSGKFSHEVGTEANSHVLWIREIISASNVTDIEAKLGSMVFFPVIISDEFPVGKKSSRSYSQKENAEFVNIEIPYDKWTRSDLREKRELMLKSLTKAIQETKDK